MQCGDRFYISYAGINSVRNKVNISGGRVGVVKFDNASEMNFCSTSALHQNWPALILPRLG